MTKLILIALGTAFALVCVFGDSHRTAKNDLTKLNAALTVKR